MVIHEIVFGLHRKNSNYSKCEKIKIQQHETEGETSSSIK